MREAAFSLYKHARRSPFSRTRVRTDTSSIDNGPSAKQRKAKAEYDARVAAQSARVDRPAEEAAIAAYLAENKPKRMPKRAASAPPIGKIRAALSKGKAITFTRGRSGRTVTYGASAPQPASERGDSQAAGEYLRAAAPSRRRKRSARKRPAQN